MILSLVYSFVQLRLLLPVKFLTHCCVKAGFCGLMVDTLDNKSTFVDGAKDLGAVQDEFSEYWYSELRGIAAKGLLSLDVVQKLQRTLCVPFYDAFRFMGVWDPGDYEVGLVCRCRRRRCICITKVSMKGRLIRPSLFK